MIIPINISIIHALMYYNYVLNIKLGFLDTTATQIQLY